MTDVRHCDGPTCNQHVPLDENVITRMSERSAEDYITLESKAHNDLHFHNQQCLSAWTNENTKVKGEL